LSRWRRRFVEPDGGSAVPHDDLARQEPPVTERSASGTPALHLQPMVHVEDMAASVDFYEHLGGSIIHGGRDGDWTLMQVGSAQIGLLAHPPNPEQGEGTVELNFHSPMPLTELEERLRDSDVTIAQITTDLAFGRQLQVRSPDGLLIKINQLEPDVYA
jgi:catechol 2,3-dioxygenase-like lactoylglutathione lyase family enzyme